MAPLLVTFVGGQRGSWSVERIVAVRGASVQPASRVAILEAPASVDGQQIAHNVSEEGLGDDK